MVAAILLCRFTRADSGAEVPYACVPAATGIVLSYFDRGIPYKSLLNDVPIREDTREASLADMVSVLESRGLYCRTYQNVSERELLAWLSRNCCCVLVYRASPQLHASTIFLINGVFYATDLMSPLHVADHNRLLKMLASKETMCVIVGNRPIDGNSRWSVWMFTGLAVLVGVYLCAARRRKKGIVL